jgi:hypothetical protein
VPFAVPADHVDAVTGALLGAIDVDDGPTAEQLAVLRAVVTHLFERPDLDFATVARLGPVEAAGAIPRGAARRRMNELMVTLELCRHPETEAQIARVEEYAHAMDVGGPHLEICRTWIEEGTERATEDFDRFYADDLPQLSEPSLRDDYLHLDAPDDALAARLEALHDLPEGTLGWHYVEFYRRNGLTLPGRDTHFPAHYVSHDMNHVISDYEPTGPGEIALGAFTLAMNDNDANWLQFVANLVIHEAGLLKHGEIMPKASTMTRAGATDLVGEALSRGARCTSDLSQADHLSMADWPLASVRSYYNVVPRTEPMV